jgi:hypothetical protein
MPAGYSTDSGLDVRQHKDYPRVRELWPDIPDEDMFIKNVMKDRVMIAPLMLKNSWLQLNLTNFLARINPEDSQGHMPWSGFLHPGGFPLAGCSLRGFRRMINARRLSMMLYKYDPLDELQVILTCTNEFCMNHNHMEIADNASAGKRRLYAIGKNAKPKTYKKKNHGE